MTNEEEKATKTLNKAWNILYEGGFKFIYWGSNPKEENGVKSCSISECYDMFSSDSAGIYREKPNQYIYFYDDNTETTFLITKNQGNYFTEIKGYLNMEDSDYVDEKNYYFRNSKADVKIEINDTDIIIFAENNIDEDRCFAILKPSDSHKALTIKINEVYSSCIEKGFYHTLLFKTNEKYKILFK